MLFFEARCNELSFHQYMDSAEVYLEKDPSKALEFIELIPKSFEEFSNKDLASFYYLKGEIFDRLDNRAKVYSCYSKAIYYAENDGDLKLAGNICYDLASYLYWINETERATSFLKKAEQYFVQTGDEEGKVRILSMPAYLAYLNYEYTKSNTLILANLDKFRKVWDDTYYILFTDFMLISNYLHLDELDKANLYFFHFKTFESHPKTVSYSYDYYLSIIYVCYVDYYYDHGNLDSALHYLDKTMEQRAILDYNSLTDVFMFYRDIYQELGDKVRSANYDDSLQNLQDVLLETNISTGIEVQDKIEALDIKQKYLGKNITIAWVVLAISIIIVFTLGIFILLYRARQQKKLEKLNLKLNEQSFLKKQQDKLQIKIKGLEDYLSILKSEVSEIAYLKDVALQKKRIQELYKDLHLKLLDNDANTYDHLTLVNKLNPTFYVGAQEKFPELNEGEIIICYYIFIGLKNKEIAVFLNTTVRSIESKRLRISKKINLPEGETLVNYLVHEFSDLPE